MTMGKIKILMWNPIQNVENANVYNANVNVNVEPNPNVDNANVDNDNGKIIMSTPIVLMSP